MGKPTKGWHPYTRGNDPHPWVCGCGFLVGVGWGLDTHGYTHTDHYDHLITMLNMDLVKEVMKDLSSWKDWSRCVHKKGDGVLSVVKVEKKGGRGRKILMLLRAVVENQWIARRGSEMMILRAATHMRHCSGSKRKYISNWQEPPLLNSADCMLARCYRMLATLHLPLIFYTAEQ